MLDAGLILSLGLGKKTNIPDPSMEINESSNACDESEKNGYKTVRELRMLGVMLLLITPGHLQHSRNQLHQKNVRKNRSRSHRSQC